MPLLFGCPYSSSQRIAFIGREKCGGQQTTRGHCRHQAAAQAGQAVGAQEGRGSTATATSGKAFFGVSGANAASTWLRKTLTAAKDRGGHQQ